MSELPISSPYRSTPQAPVTETERNALNARLNAAYEAGALNSDDFSARLDTLFAAQRMGELVPVVEGLPPLPTYDGPAFGSTGRSAPGQVNESRSSTRLTVAVVAVLAAVVLLIAILLIVLL